ncbi:MAG: hypothetical protein WC533_03050 [Candidatus Pacearchaeota archaeon]
MKNNKQIWVIIGISLVVAIIASIATTSLTGNVIKLNQDRNGSYQVYTKQEIDSMIPKAVSKTIDTRFDKCMTWTISSADRGSIYGNMTCVQHCKNSILPGASSSANQKCLWAGLLGEEKNEFNGTTQDLRIVDKGSCSLPLDVYFDGGYKQVTCFCC